MLFKNVKHNFKSQLPEHFSVLRTHKDLSNFGAFVNETLGHANCEANFARMELLQAAKKGDIHLIKSKLAHGENADAKKSTMAQIARLVGLVFAYSEYVTEPSYRLTPLHFAIINGHLEVIRLLISEGADVNASSNDGYTPLHLAAGTGCKETVELLLKKGAEVNAVSAAGVTSLHLAAEQGHLELTEYLLSEGANFNSETNEFTLNEKQGEVKYVKWTPLHFALYREHFNISVKYLRLAIAHKIDFIDPLKFAKGNFFSEVMKFLLSLDLQLETFNFQKLFEYAVLEKCINSIKSLVKRGVDVNALIIGRTPVRIIISNFSHTSTDYRLNLTLLKILLQYGGNPNIKDCNNLSPLDFTVLAPYYFTKFDSDPIIRLLLKRGCNEETILQSLSIVERNETIKLSSLQLIVKNYLAEKPGAKKPEFLNQSTKRNAEVMSDYWDKCLAELQKMREKYFEHNLSLFGIFLENDLNKIGFYTKNKDVLDYWQSGALKYDYPLYEDLISQRMEEGLIRRKLVGLLGKLRIGAKFSNNIVLNPDCQIKIASYLSNDSLYSLVRAAILLKNTLQF